MKVHSFYTHGTLAIGLINKLIHVFKANQKHPSIKRLSTLSRYVKVTEYCFKCGFGIYTLTAIVFLSYPLATYLVSNEIVPMIPLLFPLIDQNTLSGYIVKFLIEASAVVGASAGSTTTDTTFAMIIINVHAMAYMFSASVDDLNNALGKRKRSTSNVIKVYFRNSLLQNIDLVE